MIIFVGPSSAAAAGPPSVRPGLPPGALDQESHLYWLKPVPTVEQRRQNKPLIQLSLFFTFIYLIYVLNWTLTLRLGKLGSLQFLLGKLTKLGF